MSSSSSRNKPFTKDDIRKTELYQAFYKASPSTLSRYTKRKFLMPPPTQEQTGRHQLKGSSSSMLLSNSMLIPSAAPFSSTVKREDKEAGYPPSYVNLYHHSSANLNDAKRDKMASSASNSYKDINSNNNRDSSGTNRLLLHNNNNCDDWPTKSRKGTAKRNDKVTMMTDYYCSPFTNNTTEGNEANSRSFHEFQSSKGDHRLVPPPLTNGKKTNKHYLLYNGGGTDFPSSIYGINYGDCGGGTNKSSEIYSSSRKKSNENLDSNNYTVGDSSSYPLSRKVGLGGDILSILGNANSYSSKPGFLSTTNASLSNPNALLLNNNNNNKDTNDNYRLFNKYAATANTSTRPVATGGKNKLHLSSSFAHVMPPQHNNNKTADFHYPSSYRSSYIKGGGEKPTPASDDSNTTANKIKQFATAKYYNTVLEDDRQKSCHNNRNNKLKNTSIIDSSDTFKPLITSSVNNNNNNYSSLYLKNEPASSTLLFDNYHGGSSKYRSSNSATTATSNFINNYNTKTNLYGGTSRQSTYSSCSSTPSAALLNVQQFPMSPKEALKSFAHYLTPHEHKEILKYDEVWYMGKINRNRNTNQLPLRSTTTTTLGASQDSGYADDDNKGIRQQQQQHDNGDSSSRHLFNTKEYERYNGYETSTTAANSTSSLPATHTDADGLYKIVEGDHIAYRYEIIELLGQGSFSQVVKIYDHKDKKYVALKIIRNKKRFHQQALTEIKLLQDLQDAPYSKALDETVKMMEHFYFRQHLCIIFELLGPSLYDMLKKTNFRGFRMDLVRDITSALLKCLATLRQHRIIHCDFKPENILVKPNTKFDVKLIDFGSSCYESEQIYTYIQSRFYRSPEVILGFPKYSTSIDIWSLGCVAAELFTGFPIFPGENEQHQLSCFVQILGLPPFKTIAPNCDRWNEFFDSKNNLRNNKRPYRSPKNLSSVIKCDDYLFIDFLYKCFRWNPKERLTPREGLTHPWITREMVNIEEFLSLSPPPCADKSAVNTAVTCNKNLSGSGGYGKIMDLNRKDGSSFLSPKSSTLSLLSLNYTDPRGRINDKGKTNGAIVDGKHGYYKPTSYTYKTRNGDGILARGGATRNGDDKKFLHLRQESDLVSTKSSRPPPASSSRHKTSALHKSCYDITALEERPLKPGEISPNKTKSTRVNYITTLIKPATNQKSQQENKEMIDAADNKNKSIVSRRESASSSSSSSSSSSTSTSSSSARSNPVNSVQTEPFEKQSSIILKTKPKSQPPLSCKMQQQLTLLETSLSTTNQRQPSIPNNNGRYVGDDDLLLE